MSSITIPASVQEIGVLYTNPENLTGFNIFGECHALTSIQVESGSNYFKSVEGVLYSLDGKTLYSYPASKTETSYEIPADVTTINEEAFSNCMSLTSITFAPGSNLTTLGSYAFLHSRFITSFSAFPSTLVNFGNGVFVDTGWLKNQMAVNPYLVINGVLVSAYSGLTVPADVTFPDNITTINDQVFSNAIFSDNINETVNVTIPASVTNIDKTAFYGKAKISNIIFMEGSNLVSIGEYAFYGCNSITSLKLPGYLTTIEDSAFSYMQGLKSIAIPNLVVNIGATIFSNVTSLDYIYTDNELVRSAELHYPWGTYHYTFEPFDNYGKEALDGTVAIAGDAKLGETLSAVTANITNSNPGTYSYSWYRVNAETNAESEAIGTGSTYEVTADDIGYLIKLKVSSANYGGNLSALTGIIQKADCPAANVPVLGVVNNGSNKTFTFTGVAGVTYEYSIYNGSSWSDVSELTGTTGTILMGNLAIEAGKLNVRAKETALYKASASLVNETPFTASLEGNVQITGILKYNQTLTANTAGYQDNAHIIFNWYRSGDNTPIKTGSSNEYTTVAEDIGKTISVKVSAGGYTGNLEDATDSTVSKADAVITIAGGKGSYSKTYGDGDFYLEGITNNVNGLITYYNADGLTIAADGKVHINAAVDGKYIVELRLAETDCFNAAESKNISITVGKAHSVILSLSNLNQTSNAISAPVVTMIPYSNAAYAKIKVEYGVVSGSSIIWSGDLPAAEGNYKIKATLTKTDADSDANIEVSADITTGEQDFIISKYTAPSGGSSNGNGSSGGSPNGNSSSDSNTNSSTIKNDDGSTTQIDTVKNTDGSLTTKTTTVKPDGSKAVKENISNTTTNKDGSSKTIESIKETITAADGTTAIVTTNAVTNKNSDGSSVKQSTIALDSSKETAIKSIKTDKEGNITSSTATITAGTFELSKNKNTTVVSVNVPLSILNAVADSENATDVSIKITSDITKTAIMDSSTKSVALVVNIPAIENVNVNGTYLSKDVVSMAGEYKKNLEIKMINESGDNYTVKIAANELVKLSKDMNLSLNITDYKEIAKEDTKLASTLKAVLKSTDTEIQVVNFSDNKALGTGVTLSYDVSGIKDINAGDKVFIYRYNSKTNKLEEVANNSVVVGQDGTITTSTIKGGEFIVSPDKLTGNKITALIDKVSVNTVVTSVKSGSKTNIKVSIPDDIQKVSVFNKKGNPIGQEEAQILYKVSDNSIATIDLKGNVTAKKPGKLEVTVTVKLENGQKKTIKKTIQVK